MKALVIVKGTVKDAVLSANLHGMRLRDVVEVGHEFPTTRGYVEGSVNTINEWFTEDAGQPPYAPGSLLFWQPEGGGHELGCMGTKVRSCTCLRGLGKLGGTA